MKSKILSCSLLMLICPDPDKISNYSRELESELGEGFYTLNQFLPAARRLIEKRSSFLSFEKFRQKLHTYGRSELHCKVLYQSLVLGRSQQQIALEIGLPKEWVGYSLRETLQLIQEETQMA